MNQNNLWSKSPRGQETFGLVKIVPVAKRFSREQAPKGQAPKGQAGDL